jgi:hypothetical protein
VRGFKFGIVGSALLCVAYAANAASPTSELQKQVRAATFEVVLPKVKEGRVTYERRLPLELIPFVERTDKYWPVGSAFTIAPGQYVSAGHVMLLGVGSQFGAPALRDSEDHVFQVDRVLQFSMHEDYMVFTVKDGPTAEPLQPATEFSLDSPVFAVGNALGQGVVIRDGLLNSQTPEAQDGRWKWLRFSAAASPGNSGGPLLDEAGRVLGIVTMKSENENLNYALPIERVLHGSKKNAEFDVRESFGLPLLKNTNVATFQHQFGLPTTYADFAKKVQEAHLAYFNEETRKLFDDNAGVLFPKGESDKVLASLPFDELPSMLAQDEDGEWELRTAANIDEAKLPNEGKVQTGSLLETTVFAARFGGSDPNFTAFTDSKQFMDVLLKGVKVTRMVGLESVRATSLGAAQSDTEVRDRFGRQWRLRIWPLEFVDADLVLMSLPTPQGFVGMARYAPAGSTAINAQTLKIYADYFHVTYGGSLAQWKAFLAAKDLRPQMLDSIALTQDASGLHYRSARFDIDAPADLLELKSDSPLQLRTAFIKDGDRLRLDVAGLFLQEKRDGETYVGIFRQAKPGNEAGKPLRDRWDHMLKLDDEFSSSRGFDRDMHKFWKRTAVAARPAAKDTSEANVMYEVICGREGQLVPREIDEMQERLLRGLRIKER